MKIVGILLFTLLGHACLSQSPTYLQMALDMREPLQHGWFDPETEQVGIRGDFKPLSWGITFEADDQDGDGIYEATVPFDLDTDKITLSFKIKVDGLNNPDDGWQKGKNHQVVIPKGKRTTVRLAWGDEPAPSPSTTTGHVEVVEDFKSQKNLKARDLFIYLPPDYMKSDRRYPVLYMHDGQNLFDARHAGQEWKMDEAAEKLIKGGAIEPVIIVGIGNTEDRIDEYTPTRQIWKKELTKNTDEASAAGRTGTYSMRSGERLKVRQTNTDSLQVMLPGSDFWQPITQKEDGRYYQPRAGITFTFVQNENGHTQKILATKPPMGGKGKLYASWIVNELKPFIDRELRTMPEVQHTGLGGSSLGGLISIYMGQNYPDVFRKLLIISPSIWWDNKTILSSTREAAPTDQQFWVYVGTGEGETTVENSKAYVRLLKEKGVQVTYIEAKDGQHSERSWAAQAERMLKFFAGKE